MDTASRPLSARYIGRHRQTIPADEYHIMQCRKPFVKACSSVIINALAARGVWGAGVQ